MSKLIFQLTGCSSSGAAEMCKASQDLKTESVAIHLTLSERAAALPWPHPQAKNAGLVRTQVNLGKAAGEVICLFDECFQKQINKPLIILKMAWTDFLDFKK